MTHFRAFLEEFHDFGVDVKALGGTHQPVGNLRNAFGGQAGVHFKGGIVFAIVVGRPVIGKLAKARNLG